MNEPSWKYGLELLVLLCNAVWDLHKREILLRPTLIYGAIGLITAFFGNKGNAFLLLMSLLPGMLLMLTARFSGGKVGYGDGILLLTTGSWVGFLDCMMNLATGLLLAAAWCIICMSAGKMKQKDEIPFVPFLFLGTMGRLFFSYA